MASERQALSAWQDTLQEEIGVDEAADVVRLDGAMVLDVPTRTSEPLTPPDCRPGAELRIHTPAWQRWLAT